MAFDTKRLYSQLLTSGLQQRDPALYQVVYQLIGALTSAVDAITVINSSITTGSNTIVNNIINQILSGDDSGGGDADIVPGPQGIQGISGSAGATGPQGPIGYSGEDGEDGNQFPPIVGPQGNPGSTGSQGPIGPVVYPSDGIDGEDSYIVLASNNPSGLVFLAEQIASASASLDFTTRNVTGQTGAIFQSDFDEYIIELVGIVPANNNVGIGLRVSVAAAWISTGSYAWTHWVYGPAGTGQTANTAQTEIRIIGFVNVSNTGTFSVNGTIRLLSPLSAALHKVFGGQIHFYDTGPSLVVDMFSGAYSAISAIDGVQVLASAGNIASGAVRIYGVKKS